MLNDKLKELRNRKHLTQREVAEKLGIKRERYTQYEMGRRIPRGEMLINIANFYNVTTDYLLEEDNLQTKDDIAKDHESIEDLSLYLHTLRTILSYNQIITYNGTRLDEKAKSVIRELIDSQERVIEALAKNYPK